MEACEWTPVFKVSEMDDECRIVGGFASVAVKADGSLPHDTQGDIIDTPEAIKAWEKAFYKYGRDGRDGDHQHEFFKVSTMVEMMVFTPDKTAAVAKVLGLTGDSKAVATYVSYYVPETAKGNEVWKAVKEGKLPQFSIVGAGYREKVEDDG